MKTIFICNANYLNYIVKITLFSSSVYQSTVVILYNKKSAQHDGVMFLHKKVYILVTAFQKDKLI